MSNLNFCNQAMIALRNLPDERAELETQILFWRTLSFIRNQRTLGFCKIRE